MRLFRIWSIEHDAWWRASWLGYTRELEEAGVYSEAETREVLARANAVRINEAAIPLDCLRPGAGKE